MKKTIFFAVAVVLIAPSVASAAWWNPFSWRTEQTQATPASIEIGTPGVDVPSTDALEVAPVGSSEPNVVTKEIDNPALVLQVQELLKENLELNQRLVEMSTLRRQCDINLSVVRRSLEDSTRSNTTPAQDERAAQCDESKDAVYRMEKERLTILDTLKAERDTYGVKTQHFTELQNDLKDNNDRIGRANIEVNRYCN